MTKMFLRAIAAAACTLVFCVTGAWAATYPTAIVGTWTIRANDTTPFTVQVTAQSADAPCAAISGVMGPPNDAIMGYYCPATGGVSFLRNSAQTGATYQVFTGQLSRAAAVTYMTGSFTNYAGNGDTGAYGFTASMRAN